MVAYDSQASQEERDGGRLVIDSEDSEDEVEIAPLAKRRLKIAI